MFRKNSRTPKRQCWMPMQTSWKQRSICRKPRWRPVWFADCEVDGGVVELCVRGDRTDFPGIYPLEIVLVRLILFCSCSSP